LEGQAGEIAGFWEKEVTDKHPKRPREAKQLVARL
jgi:hypothetical protein